MMITKYNNKDPMFRCLIPTWNIQVGGRIKVSSVQWNGGGILWIEAQEPAMDSHCPSEGGVAHIRSLPRSAHSWLLREAINSEKKIFCEINS